MSPNLNIINVGNDESSEPDSYDEAIAGQDYVVNRSLTSTSTKNFKYWKILNAPRPKETFFII